MENIKEVLFRNCDKSMNAYLRSKKQFGEYHEFTTSLHAAFCALYQIIEDCNLEQDYQAWKGLQKKVIDIYPNAVEN